MPKMTGLLKIKPELEPARVDTLIDLFEEFRDSLIKYRAKIRELSQAKDKKGQKMSWNYRVLHNAGGYCIHETYYTEEGLTCGIVPSPEIASGETLEDLSSSLKLMQKAMKMPVLNSETLKPEGHITDKC